MFAIYAGTHSEQSQAVIEEINSELNRIRFGEVSDLELERCRTRLKAARVMSRQTIGARAMHAAINLSYGLPIDDDAEYIAKLDACDAKSLMQFTHLRWFRMESENLKMKEALCNGQGFR